MRAMNWAENRLPPSFGMTLTRTPPVTVSADTLPQLVDELLRLGRVQVVGGVPARAADVDRQSVHLEAEVVARLP